MNANGKDGSVKCAQSCHGNNTIQKNKYKTQITNNPINNDKKNANDNHKEEEEEEQEEGRETTTIIRRRLRTIRIRRIIMSII